MGQCTFGRGRQTAYVPFCANPIVNNLTTSQFPTHSNTFVEGHPQFIQELIAQDVEVRPAAKRPPHNSCHSQPIIFPAANSTGVTHTTKAGTRAGHPKSSPQHHHASQEAGSIQSRTQTASSFPWGVPFVLIFKTEEPYVESQELNRRKKSLDLFETVAQDRDTGSTRLR